MIKGYMNVYDICANKDNVAGTPLEPIHVHQTSEGAVEVEGKLVLGWGRPRIKLNNDELYKLANGTKVRCIIEVIEEEL